MMVQGVFFEMGKIKEDGGRNSLHCSASQQTMEDKFCIKSFILGILG